MFNTVIFQILWALIVSTNIASSEECEVLARIDTGLLCGRRRTGVNETPYASFRGVPYAKQPLKELRFKELQPLDPWDDIYDASVEKDICPQNAVYCGVGMKPHGMSEACIHANIHVPINALPPVNKTSTSNITGLPIIVFIHGGGFVCGSGDSDLYGPEYLIAKDVIVITFNYRLNFFGFFSLGSDKIPGNNGLRDQVTLLRWVQRNGRAFGGDPDNVTLMGQSAGSVSTHLLTLSNATIGLFKRAIMMSGAGIRGFFSSTPAYAKDIAKQYLAKLGIKTTDPDEIHRQLIDIPVDQILKTNSVFESIYPICVFVPVVESRFPGVTTIIDDDPETLMAKGRGKNIPLIVGFASTECELFRLRFVEVHILASLQSSPIWTLTSNSFYTTSKENKLEVVDAIIKRYMNESFKPDSLANLLTGYDYIYSVLKLADLGAKRDVNGSMNMDNFVKLATDYDFIYPQLAVADMRANVGAPVYLYNFSYHSDHNIFAKGLGLIGLKYKGAVHVEDLSYVLRINYLRSILGVGDDYVPDNIIRDRMTSYVTNFARCSNPTCNGTDVPEWSPVNNVLQYQEIESPTIYKTVPLNEKELAMKKFFDSLYDKYANNNTDAV